MQLKKIFAIDSGIFTATATLLSVEPRFPYSKDKLSLLADRKQEERDGLPLWRSTVSFEGYGFIAVTYPALIQPPQTIAPVHFHGLRFGTSNGGFWASATSIDVLDS